MLLLTPSSPAPSCQCSRAVRCLLPAAGTCPFRPPTARPPQVTGWYPFIREKARNYPESLTSLSMTVDPKGAEHMQQKIDKNGVKFLKPKKGDKYVLLRAAGGADKGVVIRTAAQDWFKETVVIPAAEAKAAQEEVNEAKRRKLPTKEKAADGSWKKASTSHGEWGTSGSFRGVRSMSAGIALHVCRHCRCPSLARALRRTSMRTWI